MLVPRMVFADDLTGAAECAAAFLPRCVRIRWGPAPTSEPPSPAYDVTVVDTESRNLSADEAGRGLRAALTQRPADVAVLKKLDSTLRGPVAAEIDALRESGVPVIMTPALPAAGRTVVDGCVRVDGRPLADSGAWAAETRPAPASVAAAVAPAPSTSVSLADVRRSPAELAAAIRAGFAAGAVVICDAVTDDDLERIARIGAYFDEPVAWAGSAGLAGALARVAPEAPGNADGPTAEVPATPGTPGRSVRGAADQEASAQHAVGGEPPLFVLGTASPTAQRQVAALAGRCTSVELFAAELADRSAPPAMAELVAGRPAVVYVGQRGGHAPSTGHAAASGEPAEDTVADGGPRRTPDVVAGLVRSVTPALGSTRPLFLSGGETARAVLDVLGVDQLTVHATWEPGVVACTTPDGRQIITKPGDFGDDATLQRVADRLAPPAKVKEHR